MVQWGFYFDQTRCVNCKACVLACKAWNDDKRGDARINPRMGWLVTGKYTEPAEYENLPGGTGEQNYEEYRRYQMKENWRRVSVVEYGDVPPDVDVLNLSLSCNHCDDPACGRSCPTGYIYKEPDYGVVLVDEEKECLSCGRCNKACPWGSPQFYDNNFKKYGQKDPAKPRMTKCTLCIDRIKEGLKPACVAGCTMRALDAGPIDELKQNHPGWTAQVDNFLRVGTLSSETSTKPNIIFKKKIKRIL
jgi:anaerobic dimethyl sulfoxide reductase subunit B (iron-sulfur subunit)